MARIGFVLAALVLGLASTSKADDLSDALAKLSGEDVLKHIKVLASDAFEGRGPGTPGEEKTVAYLTEQFRKFGLKPGNPNGTYVQDVPLVGNRGTGDVRVDPVQGQDDRAEVGRRLGGRLPGL